MSNELLILKTLHGEHRRSHGLRYAVE